jgi:hypothetical protein
MPGIFIEIILGSLQFSRNNYVNNGETFLVIML